MSLTDLLRCRLPIQSAPMGAVATSAALPLAVAEAGGHGMYAALALPAAELEPALDVLAGRTEAFGVNFLVPFVGTEALELAADRAPYVDFFLGDPDPELVEKVRGICGWQVETAEEARAAEAAGCDVIVARASESGGRKRVDGPALIPLLDSILDATSLPVIAAGGIATHRGVAAAMAAGAAGVRVGTRFIAAAESEAHPAWISALIDADAGDAVVSTAFNAGMPAPGPHRVLRGAIDAAERLGDADFSPQPPSRDTTGAVEAMALYAGQSAGAVRAVQPAAEIVADLARGLR